MSNLSSVEILHRLVGFDTTSRGSNLALIGFVQDYLDGFGIASELTSDADGKKANLFATLGPDDVPGLVLSGHTDTVPVDGQNWSSDPFTLTERDGLLYARGSADMKGFIAACLGQLPVLLEKRGAVPLHFAFTFDEEVGCLGVRKLLAELGKREVRPAACIIGEPTSMKPITGHKGKRSLHCRVHGHECHSAYTHEGVNSVEAAAELIAHMKSLARRFRDEGPFDARFVPPYSTIHTGRIQGGTALNIVPKQSTLDFEIRNIPGHDGAAILAGIEAYAATELLPEMRAVHAGSGFEFVEISVLSALMTPDDAPVTQLVRRLTSSNETGMVSYGTEGGFYQDAGIPAVICGPGSIDQAHKPDEFIAREQLDQCDAFLVRLAHHLADGHVHLA